MVSIQRSGTGLMILIVLIVALTVPSAFAKDTCIDCHKKADLRVQNKMLFEYYLNWKDSVHDIAGVVCKDCHGGNADKGDKDSAHKGDFLAFTDMDKAGFKEIPKRCGKCHEDVLKNYASSKHNKALLEKEAGPHCSTCHGSMNVEVYYTSIIAWTCKECHNEYTGNSPEIVGEADKILHRMNVSRAFKNWVSIYYADSKPAKVKEMNAMYKDIADSWHSFDFQKLDKKSQDLLNRLKSMVNKGLDEKRKARKKM